MTDRIWCDPEETDLTLVAFTGGIVVVRRDASSSRCQKVGTRVDLTDGHILVAAQVHRCHPSGDWCSYRVLV